MRIIKIFLLLVCIYPVSLFAGEACDPAVHVFLGEPVPNRGSDSLADLRLCNEGYVVGYSFHYKSPLWVAYRLTKESVAPNSGRTGDFREDARIPDQHRAKLSDYRRSGYDRGHMAPRAALDGTVELSSDTFLLSNMTPQTPGFNQDGWGDLEAHILKLATEREEIFVYTGAVFEGVNKTLGRNRIGIPSHLFKIVWDPETEEVFSVLIPNEAFEFVEISDFVVDVDEIESWGGLNFLHEFPNASSRELESTEFPVWPVAIPF